MRSALHKHVLSGSIRLCMYRNLNWANLAGIYKKRKIKDCSARNPGIKANLKCGK